MKLSAEIIKIAMKIQEQFDAEKESLKRFAEDFGFKSTVPRIDRVDLVLNHTNKDSAVVLGKKCDTNVSTYVSIKV